MESNNDRKGIDFSELKDAVFNKYGIVKLFTDFSDEFERKAAQQREPKKRSKISKYIQKDKENEGNKNTGYSKPDPEKVTTEITNRYFKIVKNLDLKNLDSSEFLKHFNKNDSITYENLEVITYLYNSLSYISFYEKILSLKCLYDYNKFQSCVKNALNSDNTVTDEGLIVPIKDNDNIRNGVHWESFNNVNLITYNESKKVYVLNLQAIDQIVDSLEKFGLSRNKVEVLMAKIEIPEEFYATNLEHYLFDKLIPDLKEKLNYFNAEKFVYEEIPILKQKLQAIKDEYNGFKIIGDGKNILVEQDTNVLREKNQNILN